MTILSLPAGPPSPTSRSAAPVEVRLWLDPPLQSFVSQNSAARVHWSYTDPLTQVLLDPDIVIFQFAQPPNTDVFTSWRFGIDPQVIKDAVGLYHVDFVFDGGVGTWELQALAATLPSFTGQGDARLVLTVYLSGPAIAPTPPMPPPLPGPVEVLDISTIGGVADRITIDNAVIARGSTLLSKSDGSLFTNVSLGQNILVSGAGVPLQTGPHTGGRPAFGAYALATTIVGGVGTSTVVLADAAQTAVTSRSVTDGVTIAGSRILESATAQFSFGDAWMPVTGLGLAPNTTIQARQVIDCVTNGTSTITSATANFTSADVGQPVGGTNIPTGTHVRSVTNGTTIVLDQPASGSGINGVLTVGIAPTQAWMSQPATVTNGSVIVTVQVGAQWGTDNGAIINTAIATLVPFGGGEIFVPGGNWMIASVIRVGVNGLDLDARTVITIRGEGEGATTFVNGTGGAVNGLPAAGPAFGAVGGSMFLDTQNFNRPPKLVLRDIKLDGAYRGVGTDGVHPGFPAGVAMIAELQYPGVSHLDLSIPQTPGSHFFNATAVDAISVTDTVNLGVNFSGTATGVTATTLSDLTQSWGINALINQWVSAGGVYLFVNSNTATTLSGVNGWQNADFTPAPAPPVGIPYIVALHFADELRGAVIIVDGDLANASTTGLQAGWGVITASDPVTATVRLRQWIGTVSGDTYTPSGGTAAYRIARQVYRGQWHRAEHVWFFRTPCFGIIPATFDLEDCIFDSMGQPDNLHTIHQDTLGGNGVTCSVQHCAFVNGIGNMVDFQASNPGQFARLIWGDNQAYDLSSQGGIGAGSYLIGLGLGSVVADSQLDSPGLASEIRYDGFTPNCNKGRNTITGNATVGFFVNVAGVRTGPPTASGPDGLYRDRVTGNAASDSPFGPWTGGTKPAFPASGVSYIPPHACDFAISITADTNAVTVAISQPADGSGAAPASTTITVIAATDTQTVYLPAGCWITPTYSGGTPTWTLVGV